jgi:glutamine amidotransferase
MNRIAIIDYGMGNLHSVASALKHVDDDAQVVITSDANEIQNAQRVIFPGVGAMRDCMGEIKRLHLDAVVKQVIANKTPLLAICVGLQALLSHSEENNGVDCLNIFPGQVRFFGEDLRDQQNERLKVPHMGWNQVSQIKQHPLWNNIPNQARFYFVHSYYVDTPEHSLVVGETTYGKTFAAALSKDNVFATQFHPEKSAQAGLQLFKNFLCWNGTV